MLWTLNAMWGKPISAVDALFLATSSVCVTGLAPFDIGQGLVLPSQLVLLLLVQLGGIGIMGAATSLLLLSGQRLRLKERLYIAGGFGVDTPLGVVRLLQMVLKYTLVFELCGAVLLWVKFYALDLGFFRSVYYALFHSVSAFCNAGFSLFSTNLEQFSGSLLVPGVIMSLIVLGGIGFPVMVELGDYKQRKIPFLSPYTKIVLTSTAVFIVVGGCCLTLSEWNAAFADLPVWAKIWNGLFGSVTARTAGFDMVHYGLWSPEGLLVTILLMCIGASPTSTGGGLKTTTFAVLLWSAWSELRQEDGVTIWGRRIPFPVVRKALALAFIYLFTMILGSALISCMETMPFASIFFESVSALGTVGLSRGVTSEFSSGSKLVLILLMYWGRVGILTFSFSVIPRDKHVTVRFPDVNIPIG